eukprot:GSChrysophyteH1.ASY1.ANO1.1762.1 assembled CDS
MIIMYIWGVFPIKAFSQIAVIVAITMHGVGMQRRCSRRCSCLGCRSYAIVLKIESHVAESKTTECNSDVSAHIFITDVHLRLPARVACCIFGTIGTTAITRAARRRHRGQICIRRRSRVFFAQLRGRIASNGIAFREAILILVRLGIKNTVSALNYVAPGSKE